MFVKFKNDRCKKMLIKQNIECLIPLAYENNVSIMSKKLEQ